VESAKISFQVTIEENDEKDACTLCVEQIAGPGEEEAYPV
jgi:hypothetical protein